MASFRAGSLKEAERLFRSVLRKEPRHLGALNLIGVVLTQLGDFAGAEKYLRQALEVGAPSDATLYNYGNVLKALKRPAEAVDRFSQAITINSSIAETWNGRGTVFNDLQRHNEAINDFDRALLLNPRHAEALCNKGKSLASLKRFQEALSAFDAALALRPTFAEAWCGRGAACWSLERDSEAFAACEKALALRPDLAEAWLGLGSVLAKRKQYDDALQAYQKALSFKPESAEAWLVCGNILAETKRHDDALSAYDRALAVKPDLAEARLGCGNSLFMLGRYETAFAAYQWALALNPDLSSAWVGRGNVFYARKQYAAALDDYDKALSLGDNIAEAWLNRGGALFELKQYAAAIVACDRALANKPDLNRAAGHRILAKLMVCDWTNLEEEVTQLRKKIRDQQAFVHPFSLLPTSCSAAEQLQCAQRYVKDQLPFPQHFHRKSYSHDRIRIAYLSADFHDHAVTSLLVGLLEHHDKSRFEVIVVSFGPNQDSPVRQRIEHAVERFIDTQDKTDEGIADLIRSLEVDIAVDLMGYTQNARPGILARRPAPVQVAYLGFLGTMGAQFIDYLIADEIAVPFDQQKHYAEKIVHLPNCFMVTDDRMEIASRLPSREEAGLPTEGFVFCSFNNSYKLSRPMFELWMRLLHAVEGSVLWLVESNTEMVANLWREGQSCGIASSRIIFASRVALSDHLARQRLAGVFLDTSPYNAGATAAAALWAGLPVLTVIGETFVGRMAASLLYALGLPELVAHSLADYEALALKIATDPAYCTLAKDKLARNRKTYPLFDTAKFTHHIEAAYKTMWGGYRNGQPAASFAVHREDSGQRT